MSQGNTGFESTEHRRNIILNNRQEVREKVPIGGHPAGFDYRNKLSPEIENDILQIVNIGRTGHFLKALIRYLYLSGKLTIPEIQDIIKEGYTK
jgi:hypothetical protein